MNMKEKIYPYGIKLVRLEVLILYENNMSQHGQIRYQLKFRLICGKKSDLSKASSI